MSPTTTTDQSPPCPVCDAPVPARRAHDDPVGGGRPLERGSCRRCGLQLVRAGDEPWREIRG